MRSDPDAAIYWLARNVGGRRRFLLCRKKSDSFASEDIAYRSPRLIYWVNDALDGLGQYIERALECS